MNKFLSKDQKELMSEIDLYIDNMTLPHIPESKVLTLSKDKFKQFQTIKSKAEKIRGLLPLQGDRYKGFQIRSV